MRLENVWIVVISYPQNYGYEEDNVYFDNRKEAEVEYRKKLKQFEQDAKEEELEDDVSLMLRHNNLCVKGWRVMDGEELEEL